jgi:hypothetical protein
MRHAFALLSLTSLFAVACQQATAEQPTEPKPEPKPEPTQFSDRAALLRPIQLESLTLTPIVATPVGLPEEDVDVVTLDEAFAKKLVAIKEKQDETVNQLTLTNKSDKPMFLLAGEVILGGKQDRIIGQNTIIAANQTHVVPVFCVEHGRWSEGETGRVFASSGALAHGRLRAQASFNGQSEVWAEVSKKNASLAIKNGTDTYRNIANKQTKDLGSKEKQIDAAIAKVAPADRANMIGFVVALNGKIATIDMFNSPRLYRKLETKLVRSYLTEAIDVVAAKDIKPPVVADVKAFIADADKAREQKSYDTDLAETAKFDGDRAASSKVMYKPAKSGKAGKYGVSKKPSPMYENFQSKQ